jgi:TonB family protein
MNPSIHTAQVLPARGVLFLGVVAFHVLLICAFASGLIQTTIKVLVPDPPMKWINADPPRPPEDVTPPTTPINFIADYVPPIPDDIGPINLPPETAITPPSAGPVGPVSTAPVQVAPPPIRLVGRNVLPNTDNYYPASEIRAEHEGSAEVQSCVDVNGRLDGSPTIQASSGRAPLDNAAIRLARDGKYARAMRGDTAVPNCYRFRVTFTLH